MKVKDKTSNGKRKSLNNAEKIAKSHGWVITESLAGPSEKMIKLSPWIEMNEKSLKGANSTEPEDAGAILEGMTLQLLEKSLMEDFKTNFASKKMMKVGNVNLLSDPFQVTTVDNFLADKSMIPQLVSEMESIEWERKQMDLYEFYQTTDLANIKSPHLAKFYNLLNTDVKSWMQQLTGMKFKKISASCSMYTCGDHLLTHDDLLSDRLIAFVFYLSPWKGKEHWNGSMGGALELFRTDREGQPMFPVAKEIFPADNRFVFFKVEKKSYHQVGEVISKEFPRLTINGWFHGFKDNVDFDADAVKVKSPNVPIFKSPIEVPAKLSDFINKTYLKDSIKSSIQKQIEENSEVALGDFLISDVHEKIFDELRSSKLKWVVKGPSNQQNYEALNADSLHKNSQIKALLDCLSTKTMMKLLHEYTELDLYGPKAKKPKCTVEIQRWKGGCYSLIGDPSTYNNDTLDLILYFGRNDNVGVITYLTPEGDSDESSSAVSSEEEVEPVLLTIYPQNNFLNIVYRSEGTAKFTKYCSKSAVMENDFNYTLFCSYKE